MAYMILERFGPLVGSCEVTIIGAHAMNFYNCYDPYLSPQTINIPRENKSKNIEIHFCILICLAFRVNSFDSEHMVTCIEP